MMTEAEYRSDDKPGSLFQPDTVAPHEYVDSFRRKALWQPEKELLYAVLEDAVGCFQNYLLARDKKARRLFLDAETWINGEDDNPVLSFDDVCEELDVDPEFLRSGLRRWKQKKLAEAAVAEKGQRENTRPRNQLGLGEHLTTSRSDSKRRQAGYRLHRRIAVKNVRGEQKRNG